MAKRRSSQYNGQKEKHSQYNGQKEKHSQYNGQKKKQSIQWPKEEAQPKKRQRNKQ